MTIDWVAVAEQISTHFLLIGVMWFLVLIAILLDLWDRVYTNHKLNKPIISHKGRVTIAKISEYWRALAVGLLLDTLIIIGAIGFHRECLPYATAISSLVLIGIEAKSMWEHAKERKSGLTEVKDLLKMIVECATEHDAKEAIKRVGEFLDKK